MQNLISQNKDGSLTVSSLVIAEIFGRPHRNVLRDIAPYCTKLNIELSFYINELANRKRDKYYNLTESQFLKVMPFIGGEKSFEGQCLLVDEFIRLRNETQNKNRHIDAIRSLLLLDAPAKWEKLFPDDFFIAIMNLHGHKFSGNKSTPMYCANIINRWVYGIVLPDELQAEINTERGEEKKHQWFTADNGRQTLLVQISKVEMIARMSQSRADFEANCARSFLDGPLQLAVFK